VNISVCIATYNGAHFIKEQIDSIIAQLEEQDEVIIIDDCSKDNTFVILKSFSDSRLKILKNDSNIGVNSTFEKAIILAKNDIIFMSDQDDIWIEGRYALLKNSIIKNNCLLVSANSQFINNTGKPILVKMASLSSKNSLRYCKNIFDIFTGTAGYYGCTMVFDKKLREVILPFPKIIESHDLWIAKAANILKSNQHLDTPTLNRRIHGNNASVIKRSTLLKLKSRIIFAISIVILIKRVFLLNNNSIKKS
jgi:glycosyltransferase involved in cell wall biosynthesis